MSGEGGGILAGVVAGVILLPVVVTAAAAVGCACGLGLLGQHLVKAGVRRWQERRPVAVRGGSRELAGLYQRADAALARQSREEARYLQELGEELQALARQTEEAARRQEVQAGGERGRQALSQAAQEAAARSGAQLQALLQETQRRGAASIGESGRRELERIRRETQEEAAAALDALKQAQQARLDAVNWRGETAAHRAGQQAAAQALLGDAAASLELLESLAAGEDGSFPQQVQVMRQAYARARQAQEAGAYETAAAGAQQVVIRSASLVLEHQQAQEELQTARALLEGRLEGLQGELERHSRVSFTDPLYGPKEEDLDDFTQGALSQMQERLRRLRAELDTAGRAWGTARLSRELDRLENETAPQAEQILRTGREKLVQYYRRLHTLQAAASYLEDQGCELDWAQPVGGDVTQKLVVHFREPGSGNTIALSLDEEGGPEETGRMAMEVLFYYANGRPVTEAEKQSLRDGIMNALRRSGLEGTLGCTGQVNQEAADQTLNRREAVEAAPVRPLFRTDRTEDR